MEVIEQGELGSPEPYSETWIDLMDIENAMELDELTHENEISPD